MNRLGQCTNGLLLALLVALGAPVAIHANEPIDDLPDPPELRSVDGVLRGTLTIAPAEITVRGRKVLSNVINGNYMAPTLRVRRGDVIRLKAVNEIGPAEVNIEAPQPTNIHYHGMDVSPKLPERGQCVHPDQAGSKPALRRANSQGPPARAALVPRPRAHLCRRPDRLGRVRNAHRRRVHSRAVSRAGRTAPAGDGVQGLHLSRLQGWRRARQVAQRLRQPNDQGATWPVADLGAGQSRRRRILRHEARRP